MRIMISIKNSIGLEGISSTSIRLSDNSRNKYVTAAGKEVVDHSKLQSFKNQLMLTTKLLKTKLQEKSAKKKEGINRHVVSMFPSKMCQLVVSGASKTQFLSIPSSRGNLLSPVIILMILEPGRHWNSLHLLLSSMRFQSNVVLKITKSTYTKRKSTRKSWWR